MYYIIIFPYILLAAVIFSAVSGAVLFHYTEKKYGNFLFLPYNCPSPAEQVEEESWKTFSLLRRLVTVSTCSFWFFLLLLFFFLFPVFLIPVQVLSLAVLFYLFHRSSTKNK